MFVLIENMPQFCGWHQYLSLPRPSSFIIPREGLNIIPQPPLPLVNRGWCIRDAVLEFIQNRLFSVTGKPNRSRPWVTFSTFFLWTVQKRTVFWSVTNKQTEAKEIKPNFNWFLCWASGCFFTTTSTVSGASLVDNQPSALNCMIKNSLFTFLEPETLSQRTPNWRVEE